jgi:DNA uptake protein ComE-like DNA-binding protein
MRPRTKLSLIAAVAACLLAVSCTQKQQDPDEIKRETAHATSQMKQDVKAVAEGIHEGLSDKDKLVDINDASKLTLTALPGITDGLADRIISGRPYASTDELVGRRIITGEEYGRIKDRVIVGKPSAAVRKRVRPS